MLNNFEEGRGYIVPHSDEVLTHGPEKVMASPSLGGSLRMILRSRPERGGEGAWDIERGLRPGSVLVMHGETQALREHELPMEDLAPHRISLTFRSLVPGFEDALASTGGGREAVGRVGRASGGGTA